MGARKTTQPRSWQHLATQHLVLLAAGVSLLLSFLLYGNTIPGNFVYDDAYYAHRSELRTPGHLLTVWSEAYTPENISNGNYRPLAIFTFALNFLLFGESTVSFHVVNILLNGLVTWLVFLVVRRLFDDDRLAIISAIIFAFLPIHTEAVAWIKSRDELLAMALGLTAWLAFLRATTGRQLQYWWLIGSSLLYFLSMLAKDFAVVLPGVVIAVYWVQQRPRFRRLAAAASPLLLLFLIYLLIRWAVLGPYAWGSDETYFTVNPLGHVRYYQQLFTAFTIALIYIGKTLVPYNLSATYHYNQLPVVSNLLTSWQALVGLGLLLSLVFLAVYKKTRTTPVGTGALTFLLLYLIFSKLIFSAGEIVGERWMYFPSFGLSLIAGYLIVRAYQRWRAVTAILLGSLLVVYGSITVTRNYVWRNNKLLSESMIATAPAANQGYLSLASWYLTTNDLAQAQHNAEEAYRIYPNHPPLLNLMGKIAMLQGDSERGKALFQRTIELQPAWAQPYANYLLALAKEGHYLESRDLARKLLEKDPTNARLRFVMAVDEYKLGNIEESKKYFDFSHGFSATEAMNIISEF